jgi:hypothetical protein
MGLEVERQSARVWPRLVERTSAPASESDANAGSVRKAAGLLALSRDAGVASELQRLLEQAFERGRATGWRESEELRALAEGS